MGPRSCKSEESQEVQEEATDGCGSDSSMLPSFWLYLVDEPKEGKVKITMLRYQYKFVSRIKHINKNQ